MKYRVLFALQTMGGIILLWQGVPLFRNFLSGEADPGHKLAFLAIAVVGLIQPAYWLGRARFPTFHQPGARQIFLGHLLLFLSRLMFVFVGGVFQRFFIRA